MFKPINIFFLISLGLSFGCHDDAGTITPPSSDYFISATENPTLSVSGLKNFALLSGQTDIAALIKYDVKSYRLVYQTNFKGSKIKVSGLILIPDGIAAAAPIISIQHGTTFVKSEAPSTGGSDGMELFASAGYITLLPDFIGYGESSSVFHPYYDKDYSAYAVIDMIRAAKEFLPKQHVAFTDKLFLAGYSEGGYVTLAAMKEIENNTATGLTITAVAAGAGGYDLKDMFSGIATETYYSYPSYIAFVLMAYNNTYDWNKPLTYFFASPYATALATYMDGTHDGDYINQKLTTDMSVLFDAGFYERLKQVDGESDLKHAIANNDVSGWKTNVPLRLYHGTNDEIIPYHNSEITLQNFKDAGSTTVTLTPVAGGTHGSSLTPMIKDVIPWLITFN